MAATVVSLASSEKKRTAIVAESLASNEKKKRIVAATVAVNGKKTGHKYPPFFSSAYFFSLFPHVRRRVRVFYEK